MILTDSTIFAIIASNNCKQFGTSKSISKWKNFWKVKNCVPLNSKQKYNIVWKLFLLEIFVCNYFCLEIVFACIFCPGYSPRIEPLAIIAIFAYNYFVCTSGWGKSQPPLFTPEKLDMFDPIYCFQQVFWLNIRPSTKRYKQFLYLLYDFS